MKAVLNDLYSLDITEPLSEFSPAENDNFGFWARMIVGEESIGGEESFDILVCTPKWIAKNGHQTDIPLINNQTVTEWIGKNSEQSDIFLGKHYAIMIEYNYLELYDKLRSVVNSVTGETWDEIGLKLSEVGKWEFEDYEE